MREQKTLSYLKSIGTGPLLTKEQEIVLIQNIEVYQKQIVDEMILTSYSKKELKNYLSNLDVSDEGVTNLSKKLDDESSKDSIESVRLSFHKLIKSLESGEHDSIVSALNEVSLTGTIIHGVVNEIKKKHNRIIEVESRYRQVRKYFNYETDEEIAEMITSENATLKAKIKKEYALTDIKVSNKFNEWKGIVSDVKDVKTMLGNDSTFEVKAIFKKISTFEMQAQKFKDELITKNLRLVVSRAKKHINRGLDFEDLIQEGNIGLMKAVDKFDSSKKTKVSTYATWWIDQSIKRAISNKGKTVRVPTHIEWMQTKINEASKILTGKLGRPPTIEEIAKATGYELDDLKDLHQRPQHEIGLEEELSSGKSLIDLLSSDSTQNPYTITEQKIMKEKIREILSTLPPRTEKIIRLRYGIGDVPDDEGITLQAIADQIGITKQGVRVVECSAFKQLKKKVKTLVNE